MTVLAPSRAVATAALRTLLYQLSRTHGADDALVNTSQWNYIDRKGVQHGPYAFRSMLRWAERNAFHTDALPIQHDTLKCWLPLWFLPQLTQLLTSQAALGPEEVVMQDWEAAVAEVNAERSGHGILHATPSLTQGRAAGGTGLAEFPELYDSAAAPMDYEVSAITSSAAPDSCRVLVVVDTNILLSHFSFVERAFEHLTQGAPLLEVLLLVPWVVLNELDRLKDGRAKVQSGSARLALRRVRALTADRDAYMRVQTAAEHAKAVAEEPLPDASSRELRNDDFILQTSLYWRREMADALMYAGHRAAVFLLTNDRGLCVRAEANGIRCFTAAEFPVVPETLAAVSRQRGVLMAAALGMEAISAVLTHRCVCLFFGHAGGARCVAGGYG